jgi:hypothetical protein
MGYASLDFYDIAGCAALCNERLPDSTGGYCAYFNIWRAVTSGSTSGFTCSFVRLSSHPAGCPDFCVPR